MSDWCICGHREAMHGSLSRACFVPAASGGAAIGVIWCSCLKYTATPARPCNPGDTFWDAGNTLGNDETIRFAPYFDEEMSMVDTSGGGMPDEFWEHMATALGLTEEWGIVTDMGFTSGGGRMTEERAKHLAATYEDMTARSRFVTEWIAR